MSSILSLAARAEYAGTLPQLDLAQFAAANLASLITPPVHEQLLLEVARLAIAADEIAQGGTAALNGCGQNSLDLDRQL